MISDDGGAREGLKEPEDLELHQGQILGPSLFAEVMYRCLHQL